MLQNGLVDGWYKVTSWQNLESYRLDPCLTPSSSPSPAHPLTESTD